MSNLRESRLSINGVAGIVTAAGESDSDEAVVCLHSVPGSGRDFQWLLPVTEEGRSLNRLRSTGIWTGRQTARLSLLNRGLPAMARAGDRRVGHQACAPCPAQLSQPDGLDVGCDESRQMRLGHAARRRDPRGLSREPGRQYLAQEALPARCCSSSPLGRCSSCSCAWAILGA